MASIITVDYYAAYLFLCLGVAFFVVGLYFKHFWILLISGGCWDITGLYFIINAGTASYVSYFGIFCVVISLPLHLSFLWMKEKAEPKEIFEEEKDYRERLYKKTDKLYAARNRNRRTIE